ncbi:hypothetical protein HK101_001234 [Irineochytrium annulatum]|nr:hypothetical protein HK101_001234 [Irineochytrium annulatum]
MSFVAEVSEVSFGDSQKMTQAIREQRLAWYMTQYIPPFTNKRAPVSESTKPWGLLWEADAFAEQLTLIDHHFFRQIRPDTYLHLMQMPVSRTKASGNVAFKVLMEYASWFKLVSAYTATLILREDGAKKRGKAIKKFIKVARICRDLNNFNTTFAIIHGLKRNAVAKQASAWEQVPAKYNDIFKDMELLADPADGFARFWVELKSVHAPAVPFFAAYVHDLLEIHDDIPPTLPSNLSGSTPSIASSTTLTPTAAPGDRIADPDHPYPSTISPNSLINFAKFYDLYAVVAEIEDWRQGSYAQVIQGGERETMAIVLNHMRDYDILDERCLAGDGNVVGSPGKENARTASSANLFTAGAGGKGGDVGVGVTKGLKKVGSWVHE